MKLRIRQNQMEEPEDLHNEYPYAYHHVDLRSTMVPWHWHEALEFDYVVAGSVKVSTAGQTQTFQKGEAFFINTNVLTSMVNDADCLLESHLFHPVLLGGHFKSVFESKYMNPVLHNKNLDLLPLRGQTPMQKQIIGHLRQLARLQQEPDVEFQTRSLLGQIWLLLLEELKNTQLQHTPTKNQDRLLTMLAFIQEHYAQKLTLEDIADAAAVSTRECLRCFRTAIDRSPVEYLLDYRLQMAVKLLENTDLPVTEIAIRTGFGDSAYFAKMFRRTYDKTPMQHRKTCRSMHTEQEASP